MRIHLPPLAEQHRIVAKLEALLAQVNTAKDHLAAVPPIIKRFRQSVLAAACTGRLTEDWRREHPDVEPANELLERIREGRVRKYEDEREIFSDAIAERAASIILVHNHPSGNTDPSHEDIAVTKRLVEAGEILGIKIHDHIIVSKDGYTSMKERELLP